MKNNISIFTYRCSGLCADKFISCVSMIIHKIWKDQCAIVLLLNLDLEKLLGFEFIIMIQYDLSDALKNSSFHLTYRVNLNSFIRTFQMSWGHLYIFIFIVLIFLHFSEPPALCPYFARGKGQCKKFVGSQINRLSFFVDLPLYQISLDRFGKTMFVVPFLSSFAFRLRQLTLYRSCSHQYVG